MRKFLVSVIIILAAFCSLNAQTSFRDYIAENPERAANIYHRYELFGTLEDTPAPSGYKAFYISHYGRHGSRYHSSKSRFFKPLISELQKLDDAALLTAEGKQLLSDVNTVDEAHNGMEGILTQIGSREHQGIADRMFHRFPSVFKQKGKDVYAASSTIQRCLQSLANFCLALKGKEPSLDFHIYTGEKYMNYICKGVPVQKEAAIYNGVQKTLSKDIDAKGFMNLITTDPQKTAETMSISAQELIMEVFLAGSICQDIEDLGVDIFGKYLSLDELTACSYANNARDFGAFANSVENGGFLTNTVGTTILNDIVEKADIAINEGGRAADLRFGHDTGLAPLLFLIGIEGFKDGLPIVEGGEQWFCSREMCMCSNLQIVFYRNRKGDVLVKLLHNERETSIPELAPIRGPYYKWADVRDYFKKLLENQK